MGRAAGLAIRSVAGASGIPAGQPLTGVAPLFMVSANFHARRSGARAWSAPAFVKKTPSADRSDRIWPSVVRHHEVRIFSSFIDRNRPQMSMWDGSPCAFGARPIQNRSNKGCIGGRPARATWIQKARPTMAGTGTPLRFIAAIASIGMRWNRFPPG